MTTNPWEHAARAFEPATEPRWPTPGRLAAHITPTTRATPALNLIDQALVTTLETPDARLIISMPPQEGKSTRAAKDFPLWALTRNPELRVVVASYAQRLADRNGRAIRNTITAHPDLGLRVARDHGSVSEWTLDGHEGGVYSVGIGGALTGRPADCVSGDTMIDCEHGRLTAAEAFRRNVTRILAYDHGAGRTSWRNVEAARRISSRPVVDVTTASGRVLTCTPDHRVYTGRGYVPARDLRVGDALVALMAVDRVPVREPASGPEDGRPESGSARTEPLLFTGVPSAGPVGTEQDELLQLRGADPAQPQGNLLGRVPPRQADTSNEIVSPVRRGVRAAFDEDHVLFAGLRGHGALAADDRQGQLALQERDQLRPLVPLDAAADPRTGQQPVRGLRLQSDVLLHVEGSRGHPVGVGDSPHRRGRHEQPPAEPHHPVFDLPRRAPQVEHDTVAMVRPRSGEAIDVYDFQVEGTRNFFGDGVLVHNCLIIDDPIKDRREADSKVFRDNVWDWWTDTASTRLAPGAPAILILTRWHHDDLAGRLTTAPDGHLWQVINIPAQCEDPTTDPLGRAVGEYMTSARNRTTHQWDAIKTRVGSRTWASLYQGHPTPTTGNIFPRTAWATYDTPLWVTQPTGVHLIPNVDLVTELIQSWDLAFKDTATSDFVVGQVWLRRGADVYLLDQVRGRWSFTETVTQVRQLTAKWPQAVAKLVEDKANGPAVIDALHRTVRGLIPVNPEGGKQARAQAVSPLVEAGNVHLPAPELAPWVGDLIEEAATFPNGTHDDQVDALTQALTRLMVRIVTNPRATTGVVGLD